MISNRDAQDGQDAKLNYRAEMMQMQTPGAKKNMGRHLSLGK
jgi:hypothetical protein